MENAGKTVEEAELRDAMSEKGIGTPATRAAIIEGLIAQSYLIREGRELIPTAKASQLLTLLKGLNIETLSEAELTGEWEYKLSQIEKGQLSRKDFMKEIGRAHLQYCGSGKKLRCRHGSSEQSGHPEGALSEVRREDCRKLPTLCVHLMRLQHSQTSGRQNFCTGRSG